MDTTEFNFKFHLAAGQNTMLKLYQPILHCMLIYLQCNFDCDKIVHGNAYSVPSTTVARLIKGKVDDPQDRNMCAPHPPLIHH